MVPPRVWSVNGARTIAIRAAGARGLKGVRGRVPEMSEHGGQDMSYRPCHHRIGCRRCDGQSWGARDKVARGLGVETPLPSSRKGVSLISASRFGARCDCMTAIQGQLVSFKTCLEHRVMNTWHRRQARRGTALSCAVVVRSHCFKAREDHFGRGFPACSTDRSATQGDGRDGPRDAAGRA